AEQWDARASYAVAAALSLVGALMIRRLLHEPPRRASASRGSWLSQLGPLLRRHDLALVSAGTLLVNFTFAGAISTFLPLYAKNAGISEATIGTLFAVRALVSAAGRIPNSIVTRHVGSQPILLGSLALQFIVMFGIARTTDTLLLAILLALDGLAFGGYLVAGQTWVADHTEPEHRGAAVGLYSAANSVGGILGPLLLGLVAEIWSVGLVFTVNGVVLLVGAIGYLVTVMSMNGSTRRRSVPDG
ncbi:MAG: MFS transporter, partial [Vicinamibacterales bacterium]